MVLCYSRPTRRTLLPARRVALGLRADKSLTRFCRLVFEAAPPGRFWQWDRHWQRRCRVPGKRSRRSSRYLLSGSYASAAGLVLTVELAISLHQAVEDLNPAQPGQTDPSPTDPEPSDPTPTDPTDPTDPTPTDPTDPAEPTDPTDSTDPVQPGKDSHI